MLKKRHITPYEIHLVLFSWFFHCFVVGMITIVLFEIKPFLEISFCYSHFQQEQNRWFNFYKLSQRLIQVQRSYRRWNDIMCLQGLFTFIFSHAYFSNFLSSVTDLLRCQKIEFFSATLYVTGPILYIGAWVRLFRAHFLTISNENIFFKIQGTRLGAIVAPNKGLE